MNGRRREAATAFLAVVVVGLAIGFGLSRCVGPAPSPAGPTPTPPAPSPAAPTSSASPSASPAGPPPAPTPAPSPDPAAQAAGAWTPPAAVKATGCAYGHAGDGALLPDPGCTTGATNPGLPAATLCPPGFRTGPYRSVPQPEKDAVYAAYGVAGHPDATYEVDHLIPIEVGGANDRTNLWPQPVRPPPGYREKDRVENWLHGRVCAGAIALADAQRMIATDWTVFLSRPGVGSVAPRPHVGDDEAD